MMCLTGVGSLQARLGLWVLYHILAPSVAGHSCVWCRQCTCHLLLLHFHGEDLSILQSRCNMHCIQPGVVAGWADGAVCWCSGPARRLCGACGIVLCELRAEQFVWS